MAASWDPNSTKIHAKSVSRESFPGRVKRYLPVCSFVEEFYNATLRLRRHQIKSQAWRLHLQLLHQLVP